MRRLMLAVALMSATAALAGECGVDMTRAYCGQRALAYSTNNVIDLELRQAIKRCTHTGAFDYRGERKVRHDNRPGDIATNCRRQTEQKYPPFSLQPRIRTRLIDECIQNGGVYRGGS